MSDIEIRIKSFSGLKEQIEIYDKFFIGITPEYKMVVKKELLDEVDGPMLQHGIKNLNSLFIQLPWRDEYKPNKKYLDYRYQQFLKA